MIALACLGFARAEDAADLGGHALVPSTQLFVDVLAAGEAVTWSGVILDPGGASHDVSVRWFAADGAEIGVFPSGSPLPITSAGVYRAEPIGIGDVDGINGEEPLSSWSLTVSGAAPGRGRVWSRRWVLNGGGYDEVNGLDESFYAQVDGGAVGRFGLIELRTEGLTGYVYAVLGNARGVEGANALSVPEGFGLITDRLPLYLHPPEGLVPDPVAPVLANVAFDAPECGSVSPGLVGGELSFDSNVTGSWHVVCDADDDGAYDPTSPGDVHGYGVAGIGTNVVALDGAFGNGVDAPAGSYACRLWLTVGDFHYLAQDIETSYAGFRLFEVDASLGRAGLPLYWDDRRVQSQAVPMPNGQIGLGASGPTGVSSGAPAAPAVPNVNARSWGDFTTATKGNGNVLDTWTFLAREVSAPFQLQVIDPDLDTDGEGLPDAAELCVHDTSPLLADTDEDGLTDDLEAGPLASDPLDPDTDGDGLSDGEETPDPTQPRDTDFDGSPDAVDPDDDGDGVPTSSEGIGDFDDDGVPDFLDRDDDGDTVLTAFEALGDTDGDGFPDRLDADDDGDGLPTAEEDADGDSNPLDDDTDSDGSPNYLDPDDDGDGVPTADELGADTDGDGTPDALDDDDDDDTVPTAREFDGDTDGDGFLDRLDDDDDDDGLPTAEEDADGDGDPTDDDADGDGVPDYRESDDDGDGIPTAAEGQVDTDGDGLPDHRDPDDDDDDLPTAAEFAGDTDGDGLLDRHDPDDDDDGVPTLEEGQVDTDGDGLLDSLDPDDDDDGLPTEDEFDGDTDGDGLVDRHDPDDDGDGIPTSEELGPPADADDDGTPNWRDADSDGDGLPDEVEGTADQDGDGVPDFLDPDGELRSWVQGSGFGCNHGGPSPAFGLAALLGLGLVARRPRRASGGAR